MHYAGFEGPNILATEEYGKSPNSDDSYYSVAFEINSLSIDIDTCLALDGVAAPVTDLLPFAGFQGFNFSQLQFQPGESYVNPYTFRTAVKDSLEGFAASAETAGCINKGTPVYSSKAYDCLLKNANSKITGIAGGFPSFSGDTDPKFINFMDNFVTANVSHGYIVDQPNVLPYFYGGLSGFDTPSPNLCDFYFTSPSNLNC